jgi:hypothetical protein
MKILKFTEFSAIFEEELPLPDLSADMPMDNPIQQPAAQTYKLIFITAEKDWSAEYPTGGGIKKYKQYEVKPADLDQWLGDNQLLDSAEQIKDCLAGKEELSKDHFFKIKQGLRDKSLKYKELAEVEVEFDEAGIPYTDNLDVTFLKPAKEASAS